MDKGGEDEIVMDQLTTTMVPEHFEMVVSDVTYTTVSWLNIKSVEEVSYYWRS